MAAAKWPQIESTNLSISCEQHCRKILRTYLHEIWMTLESPQCIKRRGSWFEAPSVAGCLLLGEAVVTSFCPKPLPQAFVYHASSRSVAGRRCGKNPSSATEAYHKVAGHGYKAKPFALAAAWFLADGTRSTESNQEAHRIVVRIYKVPATCFCHLGLAFE